jgi:hypothetical protein
MSARCRGLDVFALAVFALAVLAVGVLAVGVLAGAARLEQRLAQPHELLMLGMERLKIGIGRIRRFDLDQDNLRIAQRRPLIEQAADL